ncbi:LysR family transcriptional regulator [Nonomuraea guangzhouensis]|uniref:LysR family transcriptional regulator n=1 Tax=Nonomuraea guangzhouensis TaxID=1291555 RepID=A0ABW4G743_9ACTN|nr:LysR family transcriptional regulator [Nonomuraea guangzhouensis]
MELRDIQIFLTLAEELHFGRTATRLHITPARVSQVIKKQERRIGGELFERTSRAVRLTRLGEQLRNDLHPIYHGLKESMERARLAAQGITQVLRIGMIPSNAHDLRPFWDTFRYRHPHWGLQIRHNTFVNPFGALRKAEIDILIAWLPVEEPDMTVGPVICTEPKVLAVATGHELTDQRSVSLEALADFGVLASVMPVPDYWEDAFVPFHAPSGRPIERLPIISNLDELYTIVGAGEAVNSLGNHVTRYHARPGITYLPIHDAPLLRWGLIWRSEAETGLIRAFAQVVRDLGTFQES